MKNDLGGLQKRTKQKQSKTVQRAHNLFTVAFKKYKFTSGKFQP